MTNDFGVKFEALEARAAGAPLLASTATLVGLPHLPAERRLTLADPRRDAVEVAELLGDASRLLALRGGRQAAQDFREQPAVCLSFVLRG